MKNPPTIKDAIFFLASLGIALTIFIGIANDFVKTKASAETPVLTEAEKLRLDPTRDFKSLDNYISYNQPEGWQKTDTVDGLNGRNTVLNFKTPDFRAPEPMVIGGGVSINISRVYDASAEATLKSKLEGQYEFSVYNVRPMTIAGKKAMTMHEDKKGHNRFVFAANNNHLWQITITSKDLEEEQKHDNTINSFLNSINFKD